MSGSIRQRAVILMPNHDLAEDLPAGYGHRDHHERAWACHLPQGVQPPRGEDPVDALRDRRAPHAPLRRAAFGYVTARLVQILELVECLVLLAWIDSGGYRPLGEVGPQRGLIGATGFEPATFRSRTGRSTRLSHAPTSHTSTVSGSVHSVPRSRTEPRSPEFLHDSRHTAYSPNDSLTNAAHPSTPLFGIAAPLEVFNHARLWTGPNRSDRCAAVCIRLSRNPSPLAHFRDAL